MPHPLDDAIPLDHAAAAAQLAYLTAQASKRPDTTALDLGAGAGRTAFPLSNVARVTAVELQPDLEPILTMGLTPPSQARTANFLEPTFDPSALPHAPYDLILILGNTLSLITDPIQTQSLFSKCARALKPQGQLVLDDTPATAWRDIAEGNWASGLATTDEGPIQLCWHDSEPIIALRYNDEIDTDAEHLKPTDTLLRLYSPSELALIAHNAHLQPPVVQEAHAVITLQRDQP